MPPMNIKEKFIYFVLTATSIILLIVSQILKPNHEFWGLFTLELGIAGVIALILIFTVEKITKEEREEAVKAQIEDISKNLFHAIYGRYIPDSVFTEVERSLFSSDVVRINHNIYYHISAINSIDRFPEKDKQNHLQCHITSKYDLKNITDKEIEYTVRPHIELAVDENLHDFVKFVSFSVNNKEQSIEDAKNTGVHVTLNKVVTIAAKSKASITTKSTIIKRKVDSEIWASKIPSDGMKITVASNPSVKIEANANHSTKLSHSIVSENNDLVIQTWEISSGIFPHQSIIFWWKDARQEKSPIIS